MCVTLKLREIDLKDVGERVSGFLNTIHDCISTKPSVAWAVARDRKFVNILV